MKQVKTMDVIALAMVAACGFKFCTSSDVSGEQ